jgi:hypothetical protein
MEQPAAGYTQMPRQLYIIVKDWWWSCRTVHQPALSPALAEGERFLLKRERNP